MRVLLICLTRLPHFIIHVEVYNPVVVIVDMSVHINLVYKLMPLNILLKKSAKII